VLSDPVLAHGGLSAGADNVATLLVVGAIIVLAWWRIVRRRTREGGRPTWLIALPVLAAVMIVAAVATPTFIRTTPSKKRPTSAARLAILSPAQGATESTKVPVKLALQGGKLAALDDAIPSKLPSNKGHIHLYVDGQILMIPTLDYTLDVKPGSHTLIAEFAAMDHGSFNPPVKAAVVFNVVPNAEPQK
jgi:hypothetical protein